MSSFDKAVYYVLDREDGLNLDPTDAGGITNFGISLRFLREVPTENLRRYGIFKSVDENTIRELILDQAIFIYRGEFWEGKRFEEIGLQSLCNYIFDMCVMHGHVQAIKLTQRAIWAAMLDHKTIRDDGILGTKTLGAINSIGHDLLYPLIAVRASYCHLLAQLRPSDRNKLNGWFNRCYRV